MTTLQEATVAVATFEGTRHPHAHPQLRAITNRVAITVTTAVVAPAVLFASTMVVFNLITAVLVALSWVAGATSWRWATGRPVSGLLLLTLGLMTAKTTFLLVTGNTFVYFIQPVFIDAAVATTFLGSLWSTQPLVARLAPDFYPLDATLAARPEVRHLFRRLTLMWGLVIILKGGVTLALLMSLPTVDYVVVKSAVIITLTLCTVIVTVLWSVIVARREGLLHAPSRLG
jgi:uncharacterized membrane protein